MTIIAGAVLALSLTACGSDTAGDSSSGDKTTANAASPTGDATGSTGTEPSTGTGGMVPDEQWAAAFKKAIPPMASVDDAEIVAAGKKICSTFTADPSPATAKAVVADAETTFKLDSVQANMWVGGAIAHFCNDQGTAYLDAQTS